MSLVGLELAIVADLHSARPVDDAHVPEVHVAAKVAGSQDVTYSFHMFKLSKRRRGPATKTCDDPPASNFSECSERSSISKKQ